MEGTGLEGALCLQSAEPSSWQKGFHGLGSASLCGDRLGKAGEHTDILSLDSQTQAVPSRPGTVCTRLIPRGKDRCPGVPQVAGEAPKFFHQYLQPDGALPPPLGGQQEEGSHACRVRAGSGGVGSHVNVPGRWVSLKPAISRNLQGLAPESQSRTSASLAGLSP